MASLNILGIGDEQPGTLLGIPGATVLDISPPTREGEGAAPVEQRDALASLYNGVTSMIRRERGSPAGILPIWNPDNPVGTERVREQFAQTADPGFQPGVMWGDRMVSQALKDRIDIANTVAGGFAGSAAPSGRGLLGVRAYHASPHSFERFDSSKIGTGEGNQAYGHGLYAAESPAVSGGGGQYDQQFTARALGKSDLNQQELSILRGLREGKSELDLLREQARMGSTFDEAQAALDRIKAAKAHIYEVNIAADPEHFLHWDKPLSEQHPTVQQAVAKLDTAPGSLADLQKVVDGWQQGLDAAAAAGRPTTRYEQQVRVAQNRLDKARAEMTGQAFLSRNRGVESELQKAGIPGIRYLDQGSRGAGEGSHNYVVFDAATLDILRKYGLAGLMLGGGAAAATNADARENRQ